MAEQTPEPLSRADILLRLRVVRQICNTVIARATMCDVPEGLPLQLSPREHAMLNAARTLLNTMIDPAQLERSRHDHAEAAEADHG